MSYNYGKGEPPKYCAACGKARLLGKDDLCGECFEELRKQADG